jgi:Tfp pilus assembly protein PilN
MTQVNLLPSDVRARQRSRHVTFAAGAGVAGVVGLLLLLFVIQITRLAAANHDLATQQSINQGYKAQIAQLQPYADLKQTVSDRQALVTGLSQGRVAWSGVLHDVSMVIPGQMWLTTMSGTVTDTSVAAAPGAPAGTAGPVATGAPVASIQFQGVSFDHRTLALWLVRLPQISGWVNSWLSQTNQTDLNGVTVYSFSTSVDLTSDATTNGGQR